MEVITVSKEKRAEKMRGIGAWYGDLAAILAPKSGITSPNWRNEHKIEHLSPLSSCVVGGT
jgi:hypothetical protein